MVVHPQRVPGPRSLCLSRIRDVITVHDNPPPTQVPSPNGIQSKISGCVVTAQGGGRPYKEWDFVTNTTVSSSNKKSSCCCYYVQIVMVACIHRLG